ncbi:MAG: VWA domain-containing protein [Deltaproteobacteria bacterium]|nr:VWA domain-containing protein [Deltaproteobacteria bacterium]
MTGSRRPATKKVRDPALTATIIAAAPYQVQRSMALQDNMTGTMKFENQDWREKIREKRIGASIMFVVDASGSMRKNQRLREAKAAVLSILTDAYRKRDRVGLVTFRGVEAKLLLPLTNSVDQARRYLSRLPAGGKTPLAAGIEKAVGELRRERTRMKGSVPVMVVISDGKPNSPIRSGDAVQEARLAAAAVAKEKFPFIFMDTDATWQEPGMGREIARLAGGIYTTLVDMSAQGILVALAKAFNH